MNGPSSRGGGSLDDQALLALARKLPEPVFSEARREEMRTAFLSTVRGLRGGSRARALDAARRRRRLLLIGAVLFAGAGAAAAAAWRIGAERPARSTPVARSGIVGRSGQSAVAAPSPTPKTAPEPRPANDHPRKLALAARRSGGALDAEAEAEIAFARGWSALRTGDFGSAAEAFGRASAGRPNALSEDALFWRGVALDRAGRFVPAREAVTEFLAQYPGSDRRGEASVILGWLLVRAGESGDARARFGAALDDPAERVRSSARAGLAAAAERPR